MEKYAIQQVSTGDTLLFSFVGYATKEVVVGTQRVINIQLQSNSELDEVVVTALALNRQKRELGYSTEKIGGEEIVQSNSPNILNAITGKAAGVQITNPRWRGWRHHTYHHPGE
jgi:iron complex outermembrane receptor protein